MTLNPRFPHTVIIYREGISNNPFEVIDTKEEIYNGACRSYARATTSAEGKVITSSRILAIPEILTEPMTGDFVEVDKNGILEYGKVTDVLPCNFGTNILYEYIRN